MHLLAVEQVLDDTETGNGTNYEIYQDGSGNTFYRNPANGAFSRWRQANGRYSFVGLNDASGNYEFFYAVSPTITATTLVYARTGPWSPIRTSLAWRSAIHR